jgi:hypothetical protein
MGGRIGQQTGVIQLGDLAIAFVFPVLQTDESETEQVTTYKTVHSPA